MPLARPELKLCLTGLWIRSYGFSGYTSCFKNSYCSDEAVEFADKSMEMISYFAYSLKRISRREGPYETFKGSLWDQGILPLDSLRLLEQERGRNIVVDKSSQLDWEALKRKLRKTASEIQIV